MDAKIDSLVLMINTWLEHNPTISIDILNQNFDENQIDYAITNKYIRSKDSAFSEYTLTTKGDKLVRVLKERIRKEYPERKKEFHDYMKREKRIVPKKLAYNLTFSELECPLCKKLNKGSRFMFNICAQCDGEITNNTTRRNKIKSFFQFSKKSIDWTKWGTIIGAILLVLAILAFCGINTINDFQKHKIEKEAVTYFEVTVSNSTFIHNGGYTASYDANIPLNIETQLIKPLELNIYLEEYDFTSESNKYLDLSVNNKLPGITKAVITMNPYSKILDINQKQYSLNLTLSLRQYWVLPDYIISDTFFQMAKIKMIVKLSDINTNETVALRELSVPVYWENRRT